MEIELFSSLEVPCLRLVVLLERKECVFPSWARFVFSALLCIIHLTGRGDVSLMSARSQTMPMLCFAAGSHAQPFRKRAANLLRGRSQAFTALAVQLVRHRLRRSLLTQE